mgnify:CR=1 FL=1
MATEQLMEDDSDLEGNIRIHDGQDGIKMTCQ